MASSGSWCPWSLWSLWSGSPAGDCRAPCDLGERCRQFPKGQGHAGAPGGLFRACGNRSAVIGWEWGAQGCYETAGPTF